MKKLLSVIMFVLLLVSVSWAEDRFSEKDLDQLLINMSDSLIVLRDFNPYIKKNLEASHIYITQSGNEVNRLCRVYNKCEKELSKGSKAFLLNTIQVASTSYYIQLEGYLNSFKEYDGPVANASSYFDHINVLERHTKSIKRISKKAYTKRIELKGDKE